MAGRPAGSEHAVVPIDGEQEKRRTTGFRKIVPDKWEFGNEYFRKGHKELLSEIRRRKLVTPSSATKVVVNDCKATIGGNTPSSPANSGEDFGSTSTSSPDSKNPGSVETSATQFATLSNENEKLKRDNETLNSELVQTKKHCDELIAFLTKNMKVGTDQISQILCHGSCEMDRVIFDEPTDEMKDDDENVESKKVEGENEQSLKLFGVWMKENKNKRTRDEISGSHLTEKVKTDFHPAPLTKISKVCD
ncbi:hypothetical protein ACFE04_022029 [Oxalis oulophora]